MTDYLYDICFNIKNHQEELDDALRAGATMPEALQRLNARLKGATEEARIIEGFLAQPGVRMLGGELLSETPLNHPLLVPSRGLGPLGIKNCLDFIEANRKAFGVGLSYVAPISPTTLLEYPAHSLFMNAREYSELRRFGLDGIEIVSHREWLKEGRMAFLVAGDRSVLVQVHRQIPMGNMYLMAKQPSVETTTYIKVRR